MPRTDTFLRTAGVYEATCCGGQVELGAGDRLPVCPTCKSYAVWLPVTLADDAERPQQPKPPAARADRRVRERRVRERRARKT